MKNFDTLFKQTNKKIEMKKITQYKHSNFSSIINYLKTDSKV